MCYGQFATFRLASAYFVHVLHTIEVAHPVFLAPNRTFTGNSFYFTLDSGPDRPGNMLSYPNSCCGPFPYLSEPQFLFLRLNSCVHTIHAPETPAESNSHQLWTLITFFWLGFFQPYFRKSLRYIYIYIYISFFLSLLQNCTAKKKSFFYKHLTRSLC